MDDAAFPPDSILPIRGEMGCAVLAREFGDCQWFEHIQPEKKPVPAELFAVPETAKMPPRPYRATPSKQDEDLSRQFRFPSRTCSKTAGTVRGTNIHAFFERIKKWSTFTPPENTSPEILEHWKICARNPEIAALLDQECELWREQRFDVILKEAGQQIFLSGCFDRVQIFTDSSGKPVRAEIIDFKSNEIQPENVQETADHYRLQMDSYRRALAQLLHLPPEKIATYLLFTRIGVLHRCNDRN